jgi:hypothetical protein
MHFRQVATTVACVVASVSLGGCRETLARAIPKARIMAFASPCPDRILAVGDSLQFRANIMIQNAPGGMQGPFDNWTLYDSDGRPGSFRWSLSYPKPTTPPSRDYVAGKAEITPTGVLIARDTGTVHVHARSAGKNASHISIRIIPRVTRFALLPRDTSVKVGDTVFLRADAELARPMRPYVTYFTFRWDSEPGGPMNDLLARVEQDPDDLTEVDVREFPVVAVRAGTARLTACFAGARRDTATIRISGEPLAVNRDVAPLLRVTPADTSVYVGDEVSARVRVLNANLFNGPYRLVASTGDGSLYYDSAGRGASSAFGFQRHAFVGHRYFKPGSYPVALTVSDSAGRSTTIRATVKVAVREFETRVLLPAGERAVRISGGGPDIAIAFFANKPKHLWPQHIGGAFVLTEMEGVPPLLFGRTAFDPESDGRRRVTRDVNGDGQPDDVFYLDKERLRQNGDLHVGRNRLVVTGVIPGRITRPGRDSASAFWPPIRAVVQFDAIR